MRCLLALCVLFLAHNYALADRANFVVEGTITGATCTVVLVDGGSVTLPSQNLGKLSAPDSVAGQTPFRISVDGCATAVSVYFQNDQATVTQKGRLINTVAPGADNGARNVELEILNSAGNTINLAGVQGAQGVSAPQLGSTPDRANFDFFVRYYSIGAATAGKVKSSLTFLVESL
jgi:major type 1 subunit fimbrin (pilin)